MANIDETVWEEEGKQNQAECLCLGCGFTHFVPVDLLIIEETDEYGNDMVTNPTCSECGQILMLVKPDRA